jgi:hypothetical protein
LWHYKNRCGHHAGGSVLTYRPANAGGLFQRLLRRRRLHFVTQADEEAALQRLKRHLYGGDWPGAARARG